MAYEPASNILFPSTYFNPGLSVAEIKFYNTQGVSMKPDEIKQWLRAEEYYET